MEQRRQDIIYTLLLDARFDSSIIDPEQIVSIASNINEIYKVFSNSEKIVRGIRDDQDIQYNELLMEKTWLWDMAKKKWHYIKVHNSYIDISSTTNKIVLQDFLKTYDYIPKIYQKNFGKSVYNKLKNMDFKWQSRDIKIDTHNKILDNIIKFFDRLDKVA